MREPRYSILADIQDAIERAKQGKLALFWQRTLQREYRCKKVTLAEQQAYEQLQSVLSEMPQWSDEEELRSGMEEIGGRVRFCHFWIAHNSMVQLTEDRNGGFHAAYVLNRDASPAVRRDAQPALENADQRGLGHSPNKHFATQKLPLYIRRHCLLALRMIENQYAWNFAEKMICEAVDVAEADGTHFSYMEVLDMVHHVCENAGKGYSSMYQDVKRCIPTEIDAINGAIVEQARRYNVSAPYNSLIVDLIHAIEGAYKYRKE